LLRDIQIYIKQRELVTLDDLSIHFKTDKSAMEGMLEVLIRKEKIMKFETNCNSCSGSCSLCNLALKYCKTFER